MLYILNLCLVGSMKICGGSIDLELAAAHLTKA